MEIYRYLKEADNRSVHFVLYPGECHGNSRAASRLEYHLRMLQWFDHYLKGQGGKPPFFEIDDAHAVKAKPAAVPGMNG